MSNLHSINPNQFTSDGLPIFLGDPNSKPNPTFPEYPWQYILAATGLIAEKYKRDPLPPNPEIERRLIESAFVLGQEKYEELFLRWTREITFWGPSPQNAWDALTTRLRPSSHLHLVKNSGLEIIEDHHHPSPVFPIEIKKTKKQPTPINPDLKNLPSIALVKHYALVRKTSVFDYILEQSGSLNFSKVHDFIQHKNNYKLSSRGRVVYDGSFSWIARGTRIHRNTVWNAFRWMAQRKLVTKIAPQDHRIKKNSRWYVCTSMLHNLRLWSKAYQEKRA